MKVIFLDVDGVLNSLEDLKIYREKNNIKGSVLYDVVEDRPLKLLKEIVEKTNAKIVVSSSWRIDYIRNGAECRGIYRKLKDRLLDYGMKIYDITPIHGIECQRGDEIREWLFENEVENFIILDDNSDMCEYENTRHFIRTTWKHGLTEELKDRAIEILNDSYSSERFKD